MPLLQLNPLLRSSALLALSKLMAVDARFCEDNLQLFFTMLANRLAAKGVWRELAKSREACGGDSRQVSQRVVLKFEQGSEGKYAVLEGYRGLAAVPVGAYLAHYTSGQLGTDASS